jgi:hypothetical protein
MKEITYTVRNVQGEFIVNFRMNGTSMPSWAYYTTEKADAFATGEATKKLAEQSNGN